MSDSQSEYEEIAAVIVGAIHEQEIDLERLNNRLHSIILGN